MVEFGPGDYYQDSTELRAEIESLREVNQKIVIALVQQRDAIREQRDTIQELRERVDSLAQGQSKNALDAFESLDSRTSMLERRLSIFALKWDELEEKLKKVGVGDDDEVPKKKRRTRVERDYPTYIKIKEMRQKGYTYNEIGVALGMGYRQVWNYYDLEPEKVQKLRLKMEMEIKLKEEREQRERIAAELDKIIKEQPPSGVRPVPPLCVEGREE
jgi:hypothetical protein